MFEYMYIQLSPTLCDPIDSSLPGSSVLGIFEAGVLKWVAISYSRGYSWPRDWTHVSCSSCIDRHILYHSATWEAQNTLVFAIKLHLICKYISPILHEFEQALEVGNGQGSLVCCSPWGRKESDTTEWLNWTKLKDGIIAQTVKHPPITQETWVGSLGGEYPLE